MCSTATGYDLLASQFSPEGRIYQIEYAKKAVRKSGTIIGLRGKDCVVLAAEKITQSKLHESDAINRIFTVDGNVGMAMAGFIPDGKHIFEIARTEATAYKFNYHNDIPLRHLKRKVAMYVHAYTLFGALRCFGCSLMLAACGPKGPELCCIDPSGTYQDSYGCAVGKHRGAAKTEIEKLDLKNMDGRSLVKEAARILFMLRDGKEFDMELSWVGRNTKGKHLNVPKLLFDESKRYAVAEEQQHDSEED